MEATVEQLPIQRDIPMRLEIGKYWLIFLANRLQKDGRPINDINDVTDAFRNVNALQFKMPENDTFDNKINYAPQLTNRRLMQYFQAIEYSLVKRIDGGKLIDFFNQRPNFKISRLINQSDTTIDAIGIEFKNWFNKRYIQPKMGLSRTWSPGHLEYRFALGADGFKPNEKITLKASEYYHGKMDWYVLQRSKPKETQLSPKIIKNLDESLTQSKTLSFIPAEVNFPGVPNRRWWEIEDRITSYGNISANPNEIANLVLAEFGMIYGNDWFVVPINIPTGHLLKYKRIVVTDNFGQKTAIKHYEEAQENSNWSLFDINKQRGNAAMFVPSVVSQGMQSAPLEKVHLFRDEMANLVWAVEHTIHNETGGGTDGAAAAARLKHYFKRLDNQSQLTGLSTSKKAETKYQFSSQVAENCIPFIPVKIAEGNRETAFQRASFPRLLKGLDPLPIRPRTSILQIGLTNKQWRLPFYIYEEEIQRSGITVKKSWQRVRWYDGAVLLWQGYQKTNGQGEKYSGLQFDQLLPGG